MPCRQSVSTSHADGSTIFAQRAVTATRCFFSMACVGIDMLAEFGDAPRAMRIACDQIGDDLLDAARTSAHVVKCILLLPQCTGNTYIEPEKGRQRWHSSLMFEHRNLTYPAAMRVALSLPRRHLRAGAACGVLWPVALARCAAVLACRLAGRQASATSFTGCIV